MLVGEEEGVHDERRDEREERGERRSGRGLYNRTRASVLWPSGLNGKRNQNTEWLRILGRISNRQQGHASLALPLLFPTSRLIDDGRSSPSHLLDSRPAFQAEYCEKMLRFIPRRLIHSSPARDPLPQPSYSIQRNSRGSIPVYTDVRNAGSRHLVLIRNIEGNVNVSSYSPRYPPSHPFL